MAKQGPDASSIELSHYVAVLRRRWKYVATCFVLGIAVSAMTVLVLPTRSTATTSVNVNVIAANSFSTSRPASDLIDAPTEQAMVRSTQVMSDVADGLGSGWTSSSVRRSTEATMLTDGTVLRIEFTAGSASTAAKGATLVAEQYLEYRSRTAEERLELASDRLVTRRNRLARQLGRSNTRVAEAVPDSADQVAAEMERQRISEELSSVTSQLSELQAVNTSGGQILTEADPALVETSPNRYLILASGTLGGLLLGLVVAFVANIADRRVRDGYDVVGAGGVTVLARLLGEEPELPASGHDVDQVRALRERLMSAVEARRPVLGVVEVAPADVAPSDLAANLAVSLSDSGLTTDLVLADYPTSSLTALTQALGVREITPLGRARRFRGGVSDALTVVVPDGRGTRLSTSDLLAELVADDVRVAECTVVAVAPGAGTSVRLTAGRCSHQLVLGVHEMTTSIDDLAQVSTDLRAVWAVVLGSVLLPRERLLGAGLPVAAGDDAGSAAGAPLQHVVDEVASELASERGRSAGEASRKGRLRAGNTAVVAPVAEELPYDVFPAETPGLDDGTLANEIVDATSQDGEIVDATSQDGEIADGEGSDAETLAPDSEPTDEGGGPEEDEDLESVEDDPMAAGPVPDGSDPGSLPWAFSR